MICRNILLALIIISGLGISGCVSIKDGAILSDVLDISIDANDVAPFSGVLVNRQRYDYLVRCEGYVIRQGVDP